MYQSYWRSHTSSITPSSCNMERGQPQWDMASVRAYSRSGQCGGRHLVSQTRQTQLVNAPSLISVHKQIMGSSILNTGSVQQQILGSTYRRCGVKLGYGKQLFQPTILFDDPSVGGKSSTNSICDSQYPTLESLNMVSDSKTVIYSHTTKYQIPCFVWLRILDVHTTRRKAVRKSLA